VDRQAQVDRNLSIAQKYFDGYHGSVARGRLDQVFDQDDFADTWIFCSPYLGGETTQGPSTFLAEGAVANHDTIWKRIPDYKMDHFRAWPTEAGCAWRWCVNGHGLDGRRLDFWEQLFIWTDDFGKITRFEFYDDWHGFPQTLTYAYGLTLDQFSRIDGYGSAPWVPGPSMTISSSGARPRSDPPVTDRASRNLAIAERCFDTYHSRPDDNWLLALATGHHLAPECVVFSPWFGEVAISSHDDAWTLSAIGHDKIRRRLTDLEVANFDAWPTDSGCAWRWSLKGHSVDGTPYELWQQIFVETNDRGQIARLESYFDWQGFPQILGYASGLPLEELWHAKRYQTWIAS
jgi:hypothetical protein